jgi:hypothetical protein
LSFVSRLDITHVMFAASVSSRVSPLARPNGIYQAMMFSFFPGAEPQETDVADAL